MQDGLIGRKIVTGCIWFLFLSLAMGVEARDSYPEHREDYYRVLGIEGPNPLDELFESLNKIIDQEGGNSKFIRNLKDKFGLTFGGGRKHRYIFHWGFNVDLEKHEPLMKEIEGKVREDIEEKVEKNGSEYYDEYNGIKDENHREQYIESKVEEKVEEVLSYINEERAKQNRMLIELCMSKTGLGSRSMSAGLITILWNIHVISDYLGTEREGLLSFSTLSMDLRDKGLYRLFEQDLKDAEFERKYNKVIKELDTIFGSTYSDVNRACGYLNYLCGYGDCRGQMPGGNKGAIAYLIGESKVVKGILVKNGIWK